MDNSKFLNYPHFCVICKSAIDMKKVQRFVFDCIGCEHKPEYLPPLKENDPIVIRDYGNDMKSYVV
jgi:hypothetical protein